MTTVERALNSIGKKCFISYYNDFKNCNDIKAFASKLLENNSNATSINAQITRINYAKWIFDSHQEKEALNLIINSKRSDDITIRKAIEYYNAL